MDERTYRELRNIYKRIYKLESELKNLDYSQHDESSAKIDYLAMMSDIELETDIEEEFIDDYGDEVVEDDTGDESGAEETESEPSNESESGDEESVVVDEESGTEDESDPEESQTGDETSAE